MKTYTNFEPVDIDLGRVNALADLIHACRGYGIEIEKVQFYQNGFRVVFKGFNGDAILHDGSYGRAACEWETIGFPWDEGDVSVNSTNDLADALHLLKRIKDLAALQRLWNMQDSCRKDDSV